MKTCFKCKETKSLDSFGIDRDKKDGLSTYCKDCICARTKAVYYRDLDATHAKSKRDGDRQRARNRAYVYSYLQDKQCIDCGDTRWQVLQFDHVRGEKRAGIADLIQGRISIANIQLEIDKCEIRCANCHHLKTAHQLAWAKVTQPFEK